MTQCAMKGGVLTCIGGGVKGNALHMPGAATLPKRDRTGSMTQEQAFRGIARTQGKKGASAEAVYFDACAANGVKVRGKYRKP